MNYDLPKSVCIDGKNYEIRSDYRCVLDVIESMGDPELSRTDMAEILLTIMYPAFSDEEDPMPPAHWEEAVKKGIWFINGGEEETGKEKPKLMDWSQDFRHIISPVNRIIGTDIRGVDYLHWWTFLSAYYEIGECLFAQIVSIRDKKRRGKKLDAGEREFYQRNRELVDLKTKCSEEEKTLLAQFGVKNMG